MRLKGVSSAGVSGRASGDVGSGDQVTGVGGRERGASYGTVWLCSGQFGRRMGGGTSGTM